MPAKDDRIKCKYCSWSRSRWYRTKKGKARHAWWNLRDHVIHAHEEKAELIYGWLDQMAIPEERLRGKF